MVGLKLGRLLFLTFLLFPLWVRADDPVLFEGYYRVMKGGEHVGYYVMKHEFDAKKKQFIATTFMRIEGTDDTTESVKAVANEDFRPLSYSYTAVAGGLTRTIDVKVDKTKMTGTLTHMGDTEKISKPLPKNTISSLFLIYAILRSPNGLKPNSKFDYEAVAEELAETKKGSVQVLGAEDFSGIKAMKIENTFLETKSTNIVTERGEILATISPTQKIAIELMAKPENAIGKFRPQTGLLKSLFGKVPEGKQNIYAKTGHVDAPLAGTPVGASAALNTTSPSSPPTAPTGGAIGAPVGTGAPAAGSPATGTPATGTPATGTPATGTPAAGTPAAGKTGR